MYKSPKLFSLIAVLGLTVTACSSDKDPTGPIDNTPHVLLTGGTSGSYLALGPTLQSITGIEDKESSTDWDLAFSALSVTTNGGASGPGNVSAFCLCQNEEKSNVELLAMTFQDGINDFNAVTEAQIPSDMSVFKTDLEQLAIPGADGWWLYNSITHQVSPNPDGMWAIRLSSASGAAAKFRVTEITATAPPPAPVTIKIEWGIETSGANAVGETKTATFRTSPDSAAYINLSTGTVTTGGTIPESWDIVFTGYTLKLNPSGSAVSIADPDLTFEGITTISGLGFPSSAYKADGTGGTFSSHPWYRYNINPASPHRITPTYNIYLVKKGNDIYKVQIASYYHPLTDDLQNYTVRAARLR